VLAAIAHTYLHGLGPSPSTPKRSQTWLMGHTFICSAREQWVLPGRHQASAVQTFLKRLSCTQDITCDALQCVVPFLSTRRARECPLCAGDLVCQTISMECATACRMMPPARTLRVDSQGRPWCSLVGLASLREGDGGTVCLVQRQASERLCLCCLSLADSPN